MAAPRPSQQEEPLQPQVASVAGSHISFPGPASLAVVASLALWVILLFLVIEGSSLAARIGF